MVMKALPKVEEDYQLADYEQTAKNFQWSDVEKEFS